MRRRLKSFLNNPGLKNREMKNKLFAVFLLLSIAASVVAAPISYGTGAGAQAYYVPPSVDALNPEDIVLTIVGESLFQEAKQRGLTQSGFETLCKEPDKLDAEMKALLDAAFKTSSDYESLCNSVADSSKFAYIGDEYGQSLREGGFSCPPNEGKLVRLCEERLEKEKLFRDAQEDDLFTCQIEYEKNKDKINEFCKGDQVEVCPALPFNPDTEKQWEAKCTAGGGVPKRVGACGIPLCEFEGVKPPIIVDPGVCPKTAVFAGWEEVCRRSGGVPKEETKGICKVPTCDFGEEPTICPAIYTPPDWQQKCRERGGVPVPDNAYGCPRAECRMPDQCSAFKRTFLQFGEQCRKEGGKPFQTIDAAGCEQRYCDYGGVKPVPEPCPEVQTGWYEQCRKDGGRPNEVPDPARPACMRFSCSQEEPRVSYCPSTSENEQRKLSCLSSGGSFYYTYGQDNCEIIQCFTSGIEGTCSFVDNSELTRRCEANGGRVAVSTVANGCRQKYCDTSTGSEDCPSDAFAADQEKRCFERGGKVKSNVYTLANGKTCGSRFCQLPDDSIPEYTCPASEELNRQEGLCRSNGGTPKRVTDSASVGTARVSCQRVECDKAAPVVCLAPPVCASGSESIVTNYNDRGCPVYTCQAKQQQETPACPSSVCSSGSASSTCSSGQVRVNGEPYPAWDPTSNQRCQCESSWCQDDTSNLPACGASACGYSTQCGADEIKKTGSSYTSWQPSSSGGQQKCSCQSTWCEPDTSKLRACSSSVCSPGGSRECGPNEIRRTTTSSSPYTMWENGQQCTCQSSASSWCEPDYSKLSVCSADSGCSTTPTCTAGQTLKTSSSPYQYTKSDGSQCACYSKWCETDYSSLPTCSAQSTCSSSTSACGASQVRKTSSSMYSATEPDGKQCSCQSSWCETDYSSLPTCGEQACPTPTCTGGQTVQTSGSPYQSTEASGAQCACYSKWCSSSTGGTATGGGGGSGTNTTGGTGTGTGTVTTNGSGTGSGDGSCNCPANPAPTCAAGFDAVSSQYDYQSTGCGSIRCWRTTCEPTPTAPTANSSARSARITGFTVFRPLPSTTNEFCTPEGADRDAFINSCISHRWVLKQVSYEDENLRETCRKEVAANLPELYRFCQVASDPGREALERAQRAKDRLEDAYEQCRGIANREMVLELLKKKARVECQRLASSESNALRLLANDLPPGDKLAVQVADDKLELTRAELEQLRADIRRDVLTEVQATFARLLGARADEEIRQAVLKEQQATELAAVADSIAQVCEKASDELKAQCEQTALAIKAQSEALAAEAQSQRVSSGGLGSVVNVLISLLTGQAVPVPSPASPVPVATEAPVSLPLTE